MFGNTKFVDNLIAGGMKVIKLSSHALTAILLKLKEESVHPCNRLQYLKQKICQKQVSVITQSNDCLKNKVWGGK